MRNVAGLRRFPCPGLTNSDSLCDVRIISPAMFCDVVHLRVNRFERRLCLEFIAEVENVGHAAVESRQGSLLVWLLIAGRSLITLCAVDT